MCEKAYTVTNKPDKIMCSYLSHSNNTNSHSDNTNSSVYVAIMRHMDAELWTLAQNNIHAY